MWPEVNKSSSLSLFLCVYYTRVVRHDLFACMCVRTLLLFVSEGVGVFVI